MTEPVFEIVKQEKSFIEDDAKTSKQYTNLILEYLSASYGYYTEIFLRKISEQTIRTHSFLARLNIKKLLRESCKVYALSDLQLIFLAYFSNLHKWNTKNPIISKFVVLNMTLQENFEKQYQELKLFLLMMSYFVKSYVGNEKDFSIIDKYMKKQNKNFLSLYKNWVKSCPSECFAISPRQLNKIYSQHSKNCQKITKKKNYNEMVDNIIDLSITYSIIPTKKTENQEPKKRVKLDPQVIETTNKEEKYLVKPIPEIPQHSEIKKPISKISLNKKKNNQVNGMTLDYYQQKMESSIFIEPKQETNKDANKSFLDFGLSYLDFRSNRSGSSGIPPIPWKPTEGFFQKSRFD